MLMVWGTFKGGYRGSMGIYRVFKLGCKGGHRGSFRDI